MREGRVQRINTEDSIFVSTKKRVGENTTHGRENIIFVE